MDFINAFYSLSFKRFNKKLTYKSSMINIWVISKVYICQKHKKMKKLLHVSALLILILGIVSFSFPDEKEKEKAPKLNSISISGKVIDAKTSEILVGVAVKLEGTNHSTYTDFDGKFVFNSLTPRSYNITSTLISYKKKSIKLELKEKDEVNIKLEIDK